MQGATAEADGASGMVPKPLAGDQEKFLRGDGTWVTISQLSPTQAQEIIQLRTDINGILGEDTGKSMREVAAEEVAKIVAEAPGDFDTLKEIADWIADHPNDLTEINSRLLAVEEKTTVLETSVGNLEDEVAALQSADDNLQAQIDALDNRLR